MRLLLSAALLAGALGSAGTALAHLSLENPVSRYGAAVLKDGPCGRTNGQRSQNVAVFAPGETIEVTWTEYINHPGHFRVSFDDDGDDDFVDPPCLADCDNTSMQIEAYSSPTVLMDDIPDTNGGDTTVMITLPNIECDNCTLQAIQVMTDKPPYTLPGNDIYYQCADLMLVGPVITDAGVEADSGAGTDEDGSVAGTDAEVLPGQDAAVAPDAGVVTPDTGASAGDSGVADPGKKDGDGGGCTCVDRARSPSFALLLVAIGALVISRRRKR